MDIYVGSIPFKLKEKELQEMFEKFGTVNSAKIVIDNITRQNKGFAFVDMPNVDEANAAIEALNGTEVMERTISVTKSENKEEQKKQKKFNAQAQANKGKNPFLNGGSFGKGGGGFKGGSKGFGKTSFNRRSS